MDTSLVKEKILDTQSMLKEMARPEMIPAIEFIVRSMGHKLIDFGQQQKFNFNEILCCAYLLADAMEISIEVMEG